MIKWKRKKFIYDVVTIIHHALRLWKSRNLTLAAKSVVFKAITSSKTIFQSLITIFVWKLRFNLFNFVLRTVNST